LISTALIPLFLPVSPVPAVDLIQAEEIPDLCHDIHAGGTLPLVVINSFYPDLRKLHVTQDASPLREIFQLLTISRGHEMSDPMILGQQGPSCF
jgi:hypothetical protein